MNARTENREPNPAILSTTRRRRPTSPTQPHTPHGAPTRPTPAPLSRSKTRSATLVQGSWENARRGKRSGGVTPIIRHPTNFGNSHKIVAPYAPPP